jgi:N-acetylmuramoyl-L-alanine amidase
MFCLFSCAHAQFAGRKFVIDPGHGGTDPGAVGIDGGAYPNEEDFVLDVALQLRTNSRTPARK